MSEEHINEELQNEEETTEEVAEESQVENTTEETEADKQEETPTENEETATEDDTPSMSDVMGAVEEVKVGDLVNGEVLAIEEDKQVIVGLEGGQEGVIQRNELSATPFDEITDVVNIGDEIEVVVIREIKDKEQGSYALSKRRVDARKVWEDLQVKYENNETIEAPVTRIVKGGLVVDAGIRGFIPASLVDVNFIEDFTPYEGKTLELEITEIEPSENRLILSHKAIQERELESKKEETLANLEAGKVVTGKVARITNFGAFIDLGGVDGLVHISEVAHEHVDNVSDYLTPGDEIEVEVLSVDPERERISLSRKNVVPGPWDNIEEKIQKDDVVDGTVKRLTDFGAFVEIFPGVEGLLHISQISHQHIATPHEVLEPGQEIQVKVLDVNPEEERLSLSIKALEEAPSREESSRPSNSGQSNRGGGSRQQRSSQSSNQPEEESAFTLGDLLGDKLSDLENFDNN